MKAESITCLVTGGAGYIGSIVSHKLLRQGYRVIVLDNLSTGSRSSVSPEARFIQGDVGDRELLQQIFLEHSVQAVLHFAGKIDVEESVRNPLLYYSENFEKPLTLLKLCEKQNLRAFVFSSTAAVYGEVGPEAVREEQRLLPINPYGKSKWAFEMALRDCLPKVPFAILRYFNVCGADSDSKLGPTQPDPKNLFRSLALTALGKRAEFLIFGTRYATPDGSPVRDYIHVEDLAEAHVQALEHLFAKKKSFTVNLGSGRGFSVLEVLQEFQKKAQFSFKKAEPRPGDPAQVVADIQNARDLFGFSPKHSELSKMVESVLSWEKMQS